MINIFNYESYYLDYLEGNLSDDEIGLLLAFLDKHPELKLEDNEDVLFYPEGIKLSSTFKNELKQIDFENDVITNANYESFCIAFHENQLNVAKKSELNAFLVLNPQLAETFRVYGNVNLAPDYSIHYKDKSALKHSVIKPLFPFISVAASALILFFGYQFWKAPSYSESVSVLARQMSNGDKNPTRTTNTKQFVISLNRDKNNQISQDSIKYTEKRNVSNQNPRFVGATELKNISKRGFDLAALEENRELENTRIHPTNNRVIEEETIGMAAFEMKNPIKPVTKRLTELTKTPIDYKTAKAVDKSKKGFYLKIGKFEFSKSVK